MKTCRSAGFCCIRIIAALDSEKKMLKDALDFCRDVGYKTAYLDTTSDLEKAISMYQRMGFVKISEKENHTWKDDLTELEFAMKL